MILISVPVLFWGVRLSYHIWKRHTREDYRYKQMREEWEAKGNFGYYFSAFAYVYIMQGFFLNYHKCVCSFC